MDKENSPVVVKKINSALKGFTKSYNIELVDVKRKDDLLMQIFRTPDAVEKQMAEFRNEKGDDTIFRRAYFNCYTKTVINADETTLKELLATSGQEIIQRVGSWIKEGSGWVIEKLINHYVNIAKYNHFLAAHI